MISGISRWRLAALLLSLLGVIIWLATVRAERQLRADLLLQARTVAMSINLPATARLSGTPADLASPDYQQLKEQLSRIRRINTRYRFLYLMRRPASGGIVMLADSEPSQSAACSPPVQLYAEAPEELHAVFHSGQAVTKGPYKDRWGVWVSAFVPLFQAKRDEPMVVLGLDIGVSGWRRDVTARAALTTSLAAVVLLLSLLATLLGRSNRQIRERETEQQQAKMAIQRERGNLQAVLNASPVGMLVFDEHENLLLANPTAEAMFHLSRQRLAATKCGDFLHCVHRTEAADGCGHSAHCPACALSAAIRATLNDASATSAARQGEMEVLVQEATVPRWISFKTGAAHLDGRCCAVLALDDITERKRSEAQVQTLLTESNQARQTLLSILEDETRAEADRKRLSAAIEQADEVIVVTDTQGRIQYVNPAFERVTGYTRQEAIGQNPAVLNSGKQEAGFYRDLWLTISSGKTWIGRFVNRRKDGTLYTEDASIAPVHDTLGAIVNYVAVKRDITETLKLQAQLLQTQKLESLGILAGGVAHEINNPIMGIMGYAQLILDQLSADSPLVEYVTEIGRETERVALIVKNLLSFARVDNQTAGPANVGDIIDQTLSLIRTVMRQDQITLTVDVPADLPPIRCRSQQIRQVVMNLLTNARDALNEKYPRADAGKQASITVRLITREDQRVVRITIEDRGVGIPLALHDRIFEPFLTTKSRDKGTGLGLSISHGIVKDHGGEMWLESEIDRGTRFHVELPVH